MKVAILNEEFTLLGHVDMSESEVNHFDSTGSATARVCLTDDEIEELGIDIDDYVYVRRMN